MLAVFVGRHVYETASSAVCAAGL